MELDGPPSQLLLARLVPNDGLKGKLKGKLLGRLDHPNRPKSFMLNLSTLIFCSDTCKNVFPDGNFGNPPYAAIAVPFQLAAV